VWVSNQTSGTVSQVHASTGKLVNTWTGATNANAVVVAMGRVFVTGQTSPGKLYMIDPMQVVGPVTEVTNSTVGNAPIGIAFDGSRIWTANTGSISIITPEAATPWSVTTVSAGFAVPAGLLFDGSNMWLTDFAANTLLKLDPSGAIIQTVMVGMGPFFPAFDGTNIWVPNRDDNSVSVVRAATGAVLATLTGNGLNTPTQAAFDGQRILITNNFGDSVSLWKAADLTPIGSFSTGTGTAPSRACSDGTSFWIMLASTNQLARF
jgi:YVTN family beta-propeller protein